MAIITPISPAIAGALAAFAATAVSGDEIAYGGGDLLIEFDNTHVSSITVNIAPTKTSGVLPGAGPVSIPTRSLVLATNEQGMFLIKASQISSYLNANNRVPITYTGGNVALLIRSLRI